MRNVGFEFDRDLLLSYNIVHCPPRCSSDYSGYIGRVWSGRGALDIPRDVELSARYIVKVRPRPRTGMGTEERARGLDSVSESSEGWWNVGSSVMTSGEEIV